MISGYKIIKQKNEDILFLYIDFNEFENKKKENLFLTIKKFTKNINFKGKKIFIVSSGIIICTLLINPLKIESLSQKAVYDYITKIIIHDFNNNNLTDYEINIQCNSKTKGNIFENEHKNDVNKKTNVKQNNEIIVTLYRNNGNILKLKLEDYIIGVVSSQMPVTFNIEALKAQAVVCRTHALKNIHENKKFKVFSTQSYKDISQLKLQWGKNFNKYYKKIKEAVTTTKGQVIKYKNNYINAIYHPISNCKTEDSINVLGKYIPYLKSVDSSFDKISKSFENKVNFSIEEFCTLLGLNVQKSIKYKITRNKSGRVKNIIVNNKIYKGIEFKKLLKLYSTDFSIDIDNNSVTITTHGYGHGIGMSQYGANEMAKMGYNYIQILKHYYTGVSI